jgi:hypothetical protein
MDKETLKIVGLRILQICLLAGALGLAFYEKDGWGWFLFLLAITL